MTFFEAMCRDSDADVTDMSRRNAFEQLRALYSELSDRLAPVSGTCRTCGACCRFADAGHTLFVTPLEADYLLRNAREYKANADPSDVCPWLSNTGQCTAWDGRTLGCRTYFCDPIHSDARSTIHETFLERIKQLNADAGYTACYAPLNVLLSGKVPPPYVSERKVHGDH